MSTDRQREIAAILFADVQGYTAVMQKDEAQALSFLTKFKETMHTHAHEWGGEVISFYGDGCLMIFKDTLNAIKCGYALQIEFQQSPIVPVRVGLHKGEVVRKDDFIYGDSVNIASRIESMGQPGTLLFSKEIQQQIINHPELPAVSLGEFHFKNIDAPMEVFALDVEGLSIPNPETLSGKFKESQNKWSNKIRNGLILLLLVLLGGLSWWSFSDKGKSTTLSVNDEQTIAVLPFNYDGKDEEGEIVSRGIAEDILTQLSNISDLKVISRNSSKQYHTSEKSDVQIGEELNAGSLIRGTVRSIGEKYWRINIQLIDAARQRNLWAIQYDKTTQEVFDLQSLVALKVTEVLGANLVPEVAERIKRIPTENPEAYELYYKAREIVNERKAENILTAINYLEQAVALDSTFALGYAGLSMAHYFSSAYAGANKKKAYAMQKTMAEKALFLDPDLAEAYTSLAKYYQMQTPELSRERAIQYYNKALSLKPNYAQAVHWLGFLYNTVGWKDEAYETLKEARTLDPNSISLNAMFAEATSKIGEETTAENIFLDNIKKYPDALFFKSLLIEHYLHFKRYTKAAQLCMELPDEIGAKTNLVKVYAYQGAIEKADSLFSSLDTTVYNMQAKLAPYAINPDKLKSHLLESKGQINEVFEILQKAVDRKAGWVPNISRFPYTDPVITDSRYEPLMRQADLWIDKPNS